MHKPVFNILQRVLVNHFYKVNAGFFLFWFFVLFGVVNGGQLISYHLSLIQGMIQAPVFLACVVGVWLLYTLKCINYTLKQLDDPRQLFLSILNRFSSRQQFAYMLFVHVMVYLPVLVYAAVVAAVALSEKRYGAALLVIASNVLFTTASAILYRRSLQQKSTGIRFTAPVISLPKPLFSLSLWFVWKERKQMLFVTKVFTFLLLYLFMSLYEPDAPDIRPLLLIMTVVVVAHSAIVAQIRVFEEERLLFLRNLPIPFTKRFGSLWLQYGVLLLPELLFIWKGFPLHFRAVDVPQVVLLSIGLATFLHVLLMMDDLDMETFYKTVFGTWAVLFFVLLYNPGIALALLISVVAGMIYRSHLYDFEKKHSKG